MDDCLIKPFSAREVLARVQAQLSMAQLRREAHAALQQTREEVRERAGKLNASARAGIDRESQKAGPKREANALCRQAARRAISMKSARLPSFARRAHLRATAIPAPAPGWRTCHANFAGKPPQRYALEKSAKQNNRGNGTA